MTAGEKIYRYQQKPDAGEIGAELRPTGNDHQSDDYLDNADRHHELMTVTPEHTLRHGTQILVPVGEPVKEFVQAGKERSEKECNSQRPPGGIRWVVHRRPPSAKVCEGTEKSDAGHEGTVGGIWWLYLTELLRVTLLFSHRPRGSLVRDIV